MKNSVSSTCHKLVDDSIPPLLDEAGTGIILADRDGMCTYANRQAYTLLSYPPGDLTGVVLNEFFTPGETEDTRGAPTSLHRADGSTIHVIASATQLSNGVYLIIFQDITTLAEMIESLRRSEARYRALTEVTSDWLWEVDSSGVYTYASPRVKDLLGYSPEEIVGRTPFDLMPPDEANRIRQAFSDIVAAQRPFSALENTNLNRDGTTVVLETSGVPVFDEHGALVGFRGIDRDITARKLAEESLDRDRSALAEAQRIAHLGNWDWDIANNHLAWSDEIYRIFGLAPEKFGASYEAFLEAVHPDDRDSVRQAVDKALNDRTPYHIEHRVIRPDGSERIVEERGEVYYVDGVPVRMLGTVLDVTEKKEAVTRLLQVTKVLENSNEGVVITDGNSRILTVNEAFTRITGYSEEEVRGKNPSALSSGRQNETFYKRMWAEIANTSRWQGEIWNRRKNGEIYPEWLTISALKDDYNNVINYIAVFSDLSHLKRSQDQLDYLSYHDPLTGLPNRRSLMEHLAQVISNAGQSDREFALLFIDVDELQAVNNSMGHECGDQMLRVIAERLTHCVRKEDLVARLSGDEFALKLEGIAGFSNCETLVIKLRECLAQPVTLNNCSIEPSACIGVVFYPGGGENPEALIKNADAALYEAKREGNGSCSYYRAEMTTRDSERLSLVSALRHALRHQEGLSVHYQPQVETRSGRVVGAEALLRWDHPSLGPISPTHFIPLAEENGFIVELGDWVLHAACADIRRWSEAGLRPGRIAVNVSGRQIMYDHLVERVSRALDEHRLVPDQLEIEVTESTLMEDIVRTHSVLRDLKAMGVSISIDDFGTGYSSLNYLRRFAPDKLKIDKSFINSIPGEEDEESIIRAVVAMAHSLRMQVTAEGVETPAQWGFLKDCGCDLLQGYLFSRPLPAADFSSWLISNHHGDSIQKKSYKR